MRIQTSVSAAKYQNQMKIHQAKQEKTAGKLASGKKVNKASDDAAVLAISEKMLKQINGLSQGSRNIQDGIAVSKIADGAMSSIGDLMGDLEANSIRAMNGTMSESGRAIYQQANEELIKTIDHIASTTKFNETNLLDGSGDNINIHTGNGERNVSGGDLSSKALGLDNFNFDTKTLDDALHKLNSTRSKLGAQANGLESAYRSNEITKENTTASMSRMADTDMAKAAMEQKNQQTVGAAQVLAMRNQMKNDANIVKMLEQ